MEPTESNLKSLKNLLLQGLNTNPEIRKPTEAKLKELENVNGFRICLLRLALDSAQDDTTRLLAALIIKNSIDRFWKKTAAKIDAPSSGASEEDKNKEKAILKDKLMYFEEKNPKMAKLVALIIACIAVHEWPKSWPELFPRIGHEISTAASALHLLRALYTFHQILKKFAARRFLTTRRDFEKVAGSMLVPMHKLWRTHLQNGFIQWQELFKPDADKSKHAEVFRKACEHFEIAKMCHKCLRGLIVFGIPNYSDCKVVKEFFDESLKVNKNLFELRSRVPITPGTEKARKTISKMIRLVDLIPIEAQREQPIGFRGFLGTFIEFFYRVLEKQSFTPKGELIFEEHSINALSFLNRILSTGQYFGTLEVGAIFAGEGLKFDPEAARQAKAFVNKCFSKEFVTHLTRLLITKFLLLQERDIQSWKEAPETFAQEEKLNVDFRLRPATQNLLHLLIQKYPTVSAPVILELLMHTIKVAPPQSDKVDRNALIAKESAFTSLGVSPFELSAVFKTKSVEFPTLYTQVLKKEVSDPRPVAACTRRRALMVIGEWADQIPHNMRRDIYTQIAAVFKDEDIVVRLAAANTLRILVDHMHFEETLEEFKPLLNGFLEALFKLIYDVRELDTRNPILDVIGKLVFAVGPFIKTALVPLQKNLEALWTRCEQQNILRLGILGILKFMVDAVGTDSLKLHDFLIPVLEHCIDTTPSVQEKRAYLYEQGFELWHSTLQNSPVYTPKLNALFKNWISFYEISVQYLESSMRVLESYILLGQDSFLKSYGKVVSKIMNTLIDPKSDNCLSDEGITRLFPVFETLAELYPTEFIGNFPVACTEMIKELADEKKQRNDAILIGYLHIFARLFYQNFVATMRFIGERADGGLYPAILSILDTWFDKFDNFVEPYKKKLSVLAMSNFVAVPDTRILEKFGQVLNCVTIVLVDLEEDNSASYLPEVDKDEKVMKESQRVQLMVSKDPATRANVRTYFLEKLDICRNQLGPEKFRALIASVDPVILEEFQKYAKVSFKSPPPKS